jgi:tetratricopeptide (TPR) repeat protein
VALSSRKSLKRHLHLPGSKGLGHGQPGGKFLFLLSLEPSDNSLDLANRNRTASNSSAALSVASTAVHSNFRGIGSTTRSRQPSATPSIAPERVPVGRTSGESRILSNLWLMSAATFRRWGKLEQCLVAINEAETLDPENGDVWIQLGLYHSALSPPNTQAAQSAHTKAILLRPLSPTGLIHLSNLYLGLGQVDLAHTILNEITQDSGWDLPEAWVLLARACKAQGRAVRERECLIYALALEQTRGARGWRDAVDRWL